MITVEIGHGRNENDRRIIEGELRRLLRNERFSSAPQMSAFLQYVVTQTLQGNGSRMKAYTIGVDALGKPDTFDAQDDPSVRVLALRLRKVLKNIYDSEQISEAKIELKLGSYAPVFYHNKAQPSDFGYLKAAHMRSKSVVNPSAPRMAEASSFA